jgi:leucyl-tRNA synthetase
VDGGATQAAADLRREVHHVLRQVDADYERLQYNTVISGAMKMLNAIEAAKLDATPADNAVLHEAFSILIRVLYPAAPHISYGLWGELGFTQRRGELAFATWPQVDEAALVQARIKLVLQINGKARGHIEVPADADDETVVGVALASPEFEKFGEGRRPNFTKVVKGRLVSIAV